MPRVEASGDALQQSKRDLCKQRISAIIKESIRALQIDDEDLQLCVPTAYRQPRNRCSATPEEEEPLVYADQGQRTETISKGARKSRGEAVSEYP